MSWKMPWWVGDQFSNLKHNFKNGYQFGDIFKSWYGWRDDSIPDESNSLLSSLGMSSTGDFSQLLGEVKNSRDEFLADREHTEAREDTAYQRTVEDMRKAGLNPYTITASPSNSSVSSVGQNTISNKLQMMGYILDLKNLDIKNKTLANGVLGNIIRGVAALS